MCGSRWGQLKVSKWALLITQLHWPHCCPSNFSQVNTLKASWNSAYNHGPLRGFSFWMMIFVLLLHSQACQELTWASWGNVRWVSRRRWNDAGARWQRTCGATKQRLFAQQQCNEIWASQPSFYCWPIGAMWHCQPAFAWGFQQWAMHPHMVFFQSRRPPDWHRETEGDWWCLCWPTIRALQWRQQAYSLLSPATRKKLCSMHMPMEHFPSGIQRNGSQVAKTGLMLTDFISWVESKLYAVLRPSFITNGSGQLS